MKAFKSLLMIQIGLLAASGADYTDSVLVNMKGVGLEVRPLDIQSDAFALDVEDVESQAVAALKQYDVRLLSERELEASPGQPYLEISIDVAHAQGPSHLFVARLELREMAELERPQDRIVSMAVPTWERKMMGVANRPEAITDVIDRLLRIFADEYHAMN